MIGRVAFVSSKLMCALVVIAAAVVIPAAPAHAVTAPSSLTAPSTFVLYNTGCHYLPVSVVVSAPWAARGWFGELAAYDVRGFELARTYVSSSDPSEEFQFCSLFDEVGPVTIKFIPEYWYDANYAQYPIAGSQTTVQIVPPQVTVSKPRIKRYKTLATVLEQVPNGMFPSDSGLDAVLQVKVRGRWTNTSMYDFTDNGLVSFPVAAGWKKAWGRAATIRVAVENGYGGWVFSPRVGIRLR